MKFRVIKQKNSSGAHSPIQVVEQDTGCLLYTSNVGVVFCNAAQEMPIANNPRRNGVLRRAFGKGRRDMHITTRASLSSGDRLQCAVDADPDPKLADRGFLQ